MIPCLHALLLAAIALLAVVAAPTRAGIPTTTISDLQRCQQFTQEIQSGVVPNNVCASRR